MTRIEHFPEFIGELPELDLPFAGARGWLLQGEKHQVVFIEFDRMLEVPEHKHGEQWEFVLAGRVELRREGKTTEYVPGGSFFIPAGIPHGATVQAGYKAMIVFNERDRYSAKD